MLKILTVALVMGGAFGCSSYDRQVDEKEKNEKLAKERGEEIARLEQENKHLLSAVKNIRVGSKFIWAFINSQENDLTCESVGYSDPDKNPEMASEYKNEIKPQLTKGDDNASPLFEAVVTICARAKES